MLFNSLAFLVFFACFFVLYWSLRGTSRLTLCLVGSYVFYGWWDYRFLGLLFVSTLIDFLVGIKLQSCQSSGMRKALLTTSLVSNLGILATFKYLGFFVESLQTGLAPLGITLDWPTINILLPAGISFYTFQTMSYSIDLYRRDLQAERSLLKFATFVSFFPQLVAGPIVRARQFLPQLQSDRVLNWREFESGFGRVLLGFFKKLVIADSIAVVADPFFLDPFGYSTINASLIVVLYAFQVYCDFSGYSDIAIGLSRMLGFALPENFCAPYFSTSPSEFWRRWHMTLSTWMRDYVYVPLGGNRCGEWMTRRNLIITMLLGGLWHGASWNFVIWGAVHAVILVVHRAYVSFSRPEPEAEIPIMILPPKKTTPVTRSWFVDLGVDCLKSGMLFIVVCVTWVFFRSPTLGIAIQILTQIVTCDDLSLSSLQNRIPLMKAVLLVAIFSVYELLSVMEPMQAFFQRTPVVKCVAYAGALWMIALFGTFAGNQFIYFQF